MVLIFVLLTAKFSFASQIRKPAQVSSKEVKSSKVVKKTPEAKAPKKIDPTLTLMAKIFRQADAVTTEMWWVVAGERRSLQRTPFAKLTRAVQTYSGLKLQKNTGFRCDTYEVKAPPDTSMRPWRASVSEICEKHHTPVIADWTLEKDRKISVVFYPENLSDLLGLGSAVLNKRPRCEIEFSESTVLVSMSCENWTQDRGSEIVDLKTFTYSSAKASIMEIKGVVLKEMNPVSKIETKVPLGGPITVTETELPPPVIAKPLVPAPVMAPPPRNPRNSRRAMPMQPSMPGPNQPTMPMQQGMPMDPSPGHPVDQDGSFPEGEYPQNPTQQQRPVQRGPLPPGFQPAENGVLPEPDVQPYNDGAPSEAPVQAIPGRGR